MIELAAGNGLTVQAVAAERARQRALHPDHTLDHPEMSDVLRLAALVEEVGEVARCLTYDHSDRDELEHELVQVAALAMAWLDSFDGGAQT